MKSLLFEYEQRQLNSYFKNIKSSVILDYIRYSDTYGIKNEMNVEVALKQNVNIGIGCVNTSNTGTGTDSTNTNTGNTTCIEIEQKQYKNELDDITSSSPLVFPNYKLGLFALLKGMNEPF